MADFETYMREVNSHLMKTCGLDYRDLPDIDYRCLFDDGVSSKEAADEALSEAGWGDS